MPASSPTVRKVCWYLPRDDDSLADAIGVLLGDRQLRERLGANGARKVQRYQWEHVAGQIMNYYMSFLSQRAPVTR